MVANRVVLNDKTENVTHKYIRRVISVKNKVHEGICAEGMSEKMKLIQLAAHYTDGMIFQRERNILIEGEAYAPCEITATLGEDTVSVAAQPGYFSFSLPPRKADRGLCLTIKACANGNEQGEQNEKKEQSEQKEQVLTLSDIYIGEVWFAGGQSNMQWPLHDTDEYRQNPYVKENSDLRFYTIGRNVVAAPDQLNEGYQWAYANDHGWVGCDEESATHFSAVAYHFAHTLYEAINIPIGIINCNVGGSSIFSWIPLEDIKEIPDLAFAWDEHVKELAEVDPAQTKEEYHRFLDEIAKTCDISKNTSGLGDELPAYYYHEPGQYRFKRPGILYKTMLERVSAFPAKGMLWYQGETEAGYPGCNHYAAALEALVGNMKHRQQDQDFAFNYVQIAPYGEGDPECWPRVNDQMRRFFLHHPDYAMITTGDVGCATDIHPQQKRPVGERLAYAAMHRSYDLPHEFTGPIAESALRLGDEVRISFIHGAGLHQRHTKPGRFELVYDDGTMKEATPELRDNAVYLSLPDGPTPKLVRYEFTAYSEVGLFNKYGFPASLFEVAVG